MRNRSKIEVCCSRCKINYLKRTDTLVNWNGMCRKCTNISIIETKIKGKNTISKRFCEDCNTEIYSYNITNKCHACFIHPKRENHYNWQGGITTINKSIRSMDLYKEWRIEVFKRDNFSCIFCNSTNIQVHHIEPLSIILKNNNISSIEDAEKCNILWNLSNGITLCEHCHKNTDSYAGKLNKKKKHVVLT